MKEDAKQTNCMASGAKAGGRGTITFERILLVAILAMQMALLLSNKRQTQYAAGTGAPQILSSDVASKESAADSPLSGVVAPEESPLLQAPPQGPRDVDAMRNHMGAMLDRAMSDFDRMERFIDFDEGWASLMSSPTLDMRDQADTYAVVFSLPDLNESDIRVTLEGRLLTVSCGSDRQTPQTSRYESFVRSVWLPGPVGDPQRACAVMTNGVLKVMVPKGEGLQASLPGRRLF